MLCRMALQEARSTAALASQWHSHPSDAHLHATQGFRTPVQQSDVFTLCARLDVANKDV